MPESLRNWLLFIYRVPTEPSRKRTYVWRHLKQLGGLYLQQGVCLLPRMEQLETELSGLARRIHEFGGEATLLKTVSPSEEWEKEMVNRFNEGRNEEYAEVMEGAERLLDELERDTRKEKFTFAELEENEYDLDRLRQWTHKVKKRDFFGASLAQETQQALSKCQQALDKFVHQIYLREGMQLEDEPAEAEGKAAAASQEQV